MSIESTDSNDTTLPSERTNHLVVPLSQVESTGYEMVWPEDPSSHPDIEKVFLAVAVNKQKKAESILTDREIKIAAGFLSGVWHEKQGSERFRITLATYRTHVKNIAFKLETRGRLQVVKKTLDSGLFKFVDLGK